MTTEKPSRMRRVAWWLRIAACLLVGLVAMDLPFTASPWLFVVSTAIVAVALTFFVRIMVRAAPGETVAPLRRKQIALAVVSTVVTVVLALGVAALLPAGETRDFAARRTIGGQSMRPTSSDADLGWAPNSPADVVGQRLHRVDPHRRRILAIGDSIMMGHGVRDDETAVRLLEQQMPGWQVLNGAVSGYSIDQYWLYLRRIIAHVRPELIIVGVFTGNDFQVTGREFSWGTSKPLYTVNHGELVRANVGARCIDAMNRSMLVRAVWTNRELAQRGIETICRPRHLAPLEHERTVARLFDAIDETARSAGVPLLYALLPVQGEYSGVEPTRMLYASRHRTLLRLLGERPRDVLDYAIDLARRPDEPALYQSDNAHFTAAGHRVLAETLHHVVLDRYPFTR